MPLAGCRADRVKDITWKVGACLRKPVRAVAPFHTARERGAMPTASRVMVLRVGVAAWWFFRVGVCEDRGIAVATMPRSRGAARMRTPERGGGWRGPLGRRFQAA